MRVSIRGAVAVGLGLVVLAGCGGGGPATTGPGGGTSAPASVAPASAPAAGGSTAGPVATPAGGSPSAAAGGGGGGGGGEGACVLSTDELAGIFGVPVTTQVIAGPPDTCDIQTDGAPLAAFVLTPNASSFVYDAYANDTGSTEVPGIGDKAAYNPNQQLLVVMKGSTLLSIAVLDEARTPEERLELMKKAAAAAVAHL